LAYAICYSYAIRSVACGRTSSTTHVIRVVPQFRRDSSQRSTAVAVSKLQLFCHSLHRSAKVSRVPSGELNPVSVILPSVNQNPSNPGMEHRSTDSHSRPGSAVGKEAGSGGCALILYSTASLNLELATNYIRTGAEASVDEIQPVSAAIRLLQLSAPFRFRL
jgi:hypothetical protein